jgi:hypothetical protein
MKTFGNTMFAMAKLDNVVLEAPVVALERDELVGLLDQVGDGGVAFERDGKDDPFFRQGVPSHDQVQPKLINTHNEKCRGLKNKRMYFASPSRVPESKTGNGRRGTRL